MNECYVNAMKYEKWTVACVLSLFCMSFVIINIRTFVLCDGIYILRATKFKIFHRFPMLILVISTLIAVDSSNMYFTCMDFIRNTTTTTMITIEKHERMVACFCYCCENRIYFPLKYLLLSKVNKNSVPSFNLWRSLFFSLHAKRSIQNARWEIRLYSIDCKTLFDNCIWFKNFIRVWSRFKWQNK